MAVTYYISAAGNDAHEGTSPARAWATIAKVNSSSFGAGDSILFEGGSTFSGSISFDSTTRGTAESPVLISSWGKGKAIISSGDSTGFKAYNTAGFTITDLIFRGSGSLVNKSSGIDFYMDLPAGRLVHILIERVEVEGYHLFGILIGSWNGSNGYDSVTIRHALVHDNGQGGIYTYAQAVLAHRNINITHTKAYNNSGLPHRTDYHTGSGIIVSGADGALVEYCEAYNNGWLNAWKGGGPVGIWGYHCNKLVIQYSESHHNKSGTAKDGGGFDIDGGCTNCTMQYNYAHNNSGPGYLVAQYQEAPEMKGVVIRFNISENDARSGDHGAIHLWSSGSNGGIQGAEIYNNTIYIEPSENATPKGVYIQSGGVHQANFRNNVIHTRGEVPLVVADTTAKVRFEGNNYWVKRGDFRLRWGTTTFASLEEWRKATAQEEIAGKATGCFVKPRLKRAGRGKTISEPVMLHTLKAYQLKGRSPLRGAGLDLEELFEIQTGDKDFWGNSLPSELSIGAHQPPLR
ncbi:right-handed parallel beta-helix repeat-containing protein [Cesiribacter sp. SM1]|uniref:right-handed parallel beta-helix repeat-containing protein n=1 Tax=Cesiribacter sp. SM1 TaxID=2861196 RepID=UPI001CD3FB48|nr:right-handed parallel beta-helix repeat-containing protein [Cesiribacter sp. SM1]